MDPEWKSVEDYYLAKLQNEKAAKERAQELAKCLTEQLNKKNTEIQELNFCINVLAGSLKMACESIQKLRDYNKATND